MVNSKANSKILVMFPSLPDLLIEYNELFDVKSIQGIVVSQSIPIKKILFQYIVHLPHLKVQFANDAFGRMKELPPVTRVFQSIFMAKIPRTKLALGIGSDTFINIRSKLQPWMKINSTLSINRPAEMSFSASSKYSNFTLALTRNDVNFMITGGTSFLNVATQIGIANNKIAASSLLLSHKSDDFMLQWSLLKESVVATIAKIQNSFKYKNHPVVIGSALQMTLDGNIDLTVAWKVNVKGSTIHSALKTPGVVQTSFETKLNSGCNMVVTAKLDHYNCDYALGASLDFPKDI